MKITDIYLEDDWVYIDAEHLSRGIDFMAGKQEMIDIMYSRNNLNIQVVVTGNVDDNTHIVDNITFHRFVIML